MATVFIPAQLRDLTGGVSQLDIAAANVRGIIAAMEERYPGTKDRLCDGDELSPALQVSIDGVMNSRGMLADVKPDSEVHFIPAIGGG